MLGIRLGDWRHFRILLRQSGLSPRAGRSGPLHLGPLVSPPALCRTIGGHRKMCLSVFLTLLSLNTPQLPAACVDRAVSRAIAVPVLRCPWSGHLRAPCFQGPGWGGCPTCRLTWAPHAPAGHVSRPWSPCLCSPSSALSDSCYFLGPHPGSGVALGVGKLLSASLLCKAALTV